MLFGDMLMMRAMTNQRGGNLSRELLSLLLVWIFGKDLRQQYLWIPKFDSAIYISFSNNPLTEQKKPLKFQVRQISQWRTCQTWTIQNDGIICNWLKEVWSSKVESNDNPGWVTRENGLFNAEPWNGVSRF